MKKAMVRLLSLTCAAAITVTLFAGCSSKAKDPSAGTSSTASAVTASEPVKLSLIQPDGGRIIKEDNPVVKEIEKRTNTKLDIQLVPSAEFTNKYNVIVASGNLPDISKLGSFGYQQYAGQGVFLDLTPYLEKDAPNFMKYIKKEQWDLVKYQGKQYALPYPNFAGKVVQVIRQDWLDALGLKMPSTLDEYEDVLKKFTFNDPDNNGKNDTYGIGPQGNWTGGWFGDDFGAIFGAYGMELHQFYLKDNKIYPTMISNEYKSALEFIKKLWDEKVIDPELFTIKGDQANQKIVQGKGATVTAWWSYVPQIYMGQLKMAELNPKVKWNPVLPGIKGPDGKSGMVSQGNMGGTEVISAKSKNPEAAIKFLDYLMSDEGWELAMYGIKGVHYTEFGSARTPEGDKAYTDKWLDVLGQTVSRLDLYTKWTNMAKDPQTVENNIFINAGYEYKLYDDAFYGIPATDESNTYEPDLVKYEKEMLIKFVTGVEPLSNWNNYVSTWKSKGGTKITDSKIKLYNELKSTKVTSGIQ